jgi:hypothetical protein
VTHRSSDLEEFGFLKGVSQSSAQDLVRMIGSSANSNAKEAVSRESSTYQVGSCSL